MPNTRKTEVDYLEAGNRLGLTWVGASLSAKQRALYLPRRRNEPTSWYCRKHKEIFKATYAKIKTWEKCPVCRTHLRKQAIKNAQALPTIPRPYVGRRRMEMTDYKALAQKHDLSFVGQDIPQTVTFPTSWRCLKGHTFERPYTEIQKGRGCRRCGPRAQKVKEDYTQLAAERGTTWAGKALPKTTRMKTLWRCSKSHEWMASYSALKHNSKGTGCPQCQDMVNGHSVSRPQRELCTQLGGILNHPCGRRRIDVALLADRIAVEYDCEHWHENETWQQATKRDRELLEGGWKVLHIRTPLKLPDPDRLKRCLKILKTTEAQALTMIV